MRDHIRSVRRGNVVGAKHLHECVCICDDRAANASPLRWHGATMARSVNYSSNIAIIVKQYNTSPPSCLSFFACGRKMIDKKEVPERSPQAIGYLRTKDRKKEKRQ